MTSYWKQFEAWATRLTRDPFAWPRIEFAVTNFLATLGIFTLSYLFFVQAGTRHVREELDGVFSDPALQQQVTVNLLRTLENDTLKILVPTAIVLALVSYFLSTMTVRLLKPMVRSQKRFIADASHELRTPLSIIKADSELALLDIGDIKPKEIENTLRSNLQEVNRMAKIIDNLLNLSFYDVKVDRIAISEINFTDVIREVVDQTQVLANQKRIHLSVGKMDEVLFSGNGTSLEQMVLNLLRNAILHTPQGGSVIAGVELKGESALFTVQDTGKGISPEDLPHVFSPFYKANSVEQVPGSGLGLTIVRRIVEMHHGTISISSEVGKGTTVSVLFPLIKSDKLVIRP